MVTALCLETQTIGIMETVFARISESLTAWKGRDRLNPETIDSALSETSNYRQHGDSALSETSNYRQHGDGALAGNPNHRQHGDGALAGNSNHRQHGNGALVENPKHRDHGNHVCPNFGIIDSMEMVLCLKT
jgi:hypothetical protein